MEATMSSIIISLALLTLLTCAWRLVNWVWVGPKKLERLLREELGFKGNPYRILYGDTKEMISVIKKTQSIPMDISDDEIAPHIIPFDRLSSKLHGKNFFIWMGTTPKLNIQDPKLIKEIFTKYNLFQKPRMNSLGKLLLPGLVGLEGEQWAKHRSLLNPAFHLEKLKVMAPAIYTVCSEMLGKWDELASGKESCEVDVSPCLSNLSADVISRTAFGSNFEEGKRIFQLQKEQSGLVVQLVRSFYVPGWRFLPTKTNRRLREIHREMETIVREILVKKEKAIREGKEGNEDLLQILLKTNMQEALENGKKMNITISIEEVVGHCKLFYRAGQDTVSSLLVWTMILLSKYQNWQNLAREEVFTVFGDSNPDFRGLNRLKILTMILYEVLRLYSPVGALTRATHKNSELGDRVLPTGLELSLPIITVHTNPELWGEDALEFKPERFSEGISKATNNRPIFFPFGAGPRICIGQNFVMVEARMAMAMILQRFSFSLSRSYVHAPSPATSTIKPLHGAPLILRKI